jgi:esterase/lipase superfamily enzyme
LAYDLSFPGATVLYSWPSQGRPLSYMVDETNVAWTQGHFQSVLNLLLSEVGARNVNVIAHSMGGRAVAHALASFSPSRPRGTGNLHHVVLAAPDIDADEFRSLAVRLPELPQRMTLYASSRDRALQVSKRFHGYPRAGESGQSLVIIPDLMDTIDATAVNTSLLGHSYYGDERSILTDIFTLVREGIAPPRFGMSRQELANLPYWVFRP